MKFLNKKLIIVGLVLGYINGIPAMDTDWNSNDTYNSNITKSNEVQTIHAVSGSVMPTTLFECNATRNEINQYEILQYFSKYNKILMNQSVTYYLEIMHNLISSASQFQYDVKSGEYSDKTKHLITKEEMQEIFSKVLGDLVLVCSYNFASQLLKSPSKSNLTRFMQEMKYFSNKYREKLRTDTMNLTQRQLENIYYKFENILTQYVKENNKQ